MCGFALCVCVLWDWFSLILLEHQVKSCWCLRLEMLVVFSILQTTFILSFCSNNLWIQYAETLLFPLRFIDIWLKGRNHTVGLASIVISIFSSNGKRCWRKSIIAAKVSGVAREGVPPPKKIYQNHKEFTSRNHFETECQMVRTEVMSGIFVLFSEYKWRKDSNSVMREDLNFCSLIAVSRR